MPAAGLLPNAGFALARCFVAMDAHLKDWWVAQDFPSVNRRNVRHGDVDNVSALARALV